MVRMILELIRNRSFTLTTSNSKRSRLRHLKYSVPQGSVLAPSFLISIYIYDVRSTTFRKYAYADDQALLHLFKDWKGLEETLRQDMAILSAYLKTWRLKLSHAKGSGTLRCQANSMPKYIVKLSNCCLLVVH